MVDVAGIFMVLRRVNLHRENHSAGALAWSHDCARRAQYLVNHEIAYPGSVTSDMMNDNGLTCFGQNMAIGVEATSPAGACVGAIDIWQEEQLRYDFANPGYNCASRQFAANVWRSMTHVGFGVGNRVNGCYVVAAVFDGNITAVDSQAWLRNVWPARVDTVLRHGLSVVQTNNSSNTQASSPSSSPPSSPTTFRSMRSANAPSSITVRGESTEVRHLRSKDGRFRFIMLPEYRMLSLEMEDDAVWGIHFGFSLLRPEEPQPTPVYLTVPFHHAAGGGGNGNNDDRDRMVLLNDGNLVVIDASRRQLWSSETANVAPGPYTLTMQDDGDCVLFGGSGVRLWASGTSGWG